MARRRVQKVARVEGGTAHRNGIEIEGLVAKPLPFRFSFDERRNRQVGDE